MSRISSAVPSGSTGIGTRPSLTESGAREGEKASPAAATTAAAPPGPNAENVASRRSVAFTFLSALATGLGFLLAFIALGAFREIVGHGTLLSGIDLLAGERSRSLTIELPVGGMLVAILPPGAFFGMGLLLALRNRLSRAAPGDATSPGTPR